MSAIEDHRLLRRSLLAAGLVSGAMGLLPPAGGGAGRARISRPAGALRRRRPRPS
jgi:hypothetical protein